MIFHFVLFCFWIYFAHWWVLKKYINKASKYFFLMIGQRTAHESLILRLHFGFFNPIFSDYLYCQLNAGQSLIFLCMLDTYELGLRTRWPHRSSSFWSTLATEKCFIFIFLFFYLLSLFISLSLLIRGS